METSKSHNYPWKKKAKKSPFFMYPFSKSYKYYMYVRDLHKVLAKHLL